LTQNQIEKILTIKLNNYHQAYVCEFQNEKLVSSYPVEDFIRRCKISKL